MDAQAGLPLCCSQTPEDRFSHDEAQLIGGKFGRSVGHKKFQQGKDVIMPLLYVWLKQNRYAVHNSDFEAVQFQESINCDRL